MEVPEASAAVAAALTGLGVTIHVGMPVGEVRSGESNTVVCGQTQVSSEALLVALGRRPNVDELHPRPCRGRTRCKGIHWHGREAADDE